MRGLGQINMPAQGWGAPAPAVTLDTSAFNSQIAANQAAGSDLSPANLAQAFNLLGYTFGQSPSDTAIVGNPISSYVAAGEPLATSGGGGGGGGGIGLPSNTSTWLWLAVVLIGGFAVIKAANL